MKKVKAQAPKKAPVKKVAPTPKAAQWEPSLHEACWWTKGDERFIGEISSLNPLVVVRHDVYDNVHRTNEIVADPKDYAITPMTKIELYQNLFN